MTPAPFTIYQDALPHLPGHAADWTSALRLRALRAFEKAGFPTTRDEAWKYTRLQKLAAEPYAPLLTDASAGDHQQPPANIEGLDCYVLPIVNGRVITGTSDRYDLPEGVRIQLLSEALAQPEAWLMEQLEETLANPIDSLDLLNLALATDGWILTIDERVTLDKPIHIQYLNTPPNQHSMMLRHMVCIGAHAKAHIIENFAGTGDHAYWQDSRSHIHVSDHATLAHTLIQMQGKQATHTQTTEVRVLEGATYQQHFVNLGAAIARHEVHGHIRGEQAACNIAGIYLGNDQQVLDHYLPTTHHTPNSRSNQLVKGVLDGQSRGIFYGNITVPEGADGTEAHQQSRALLLSEKAEADNRPELRISTDEVVCSHGAAIGQLDANALYYLMARGISKQDAKVMLTEGLFGGSAGKYRPARCFARSPARTGDGPFA